MDQKVEALPNLLDGKAYNRGQGQEGMQDDEEEQTRLTNEGYYKFLHEHYSFYVTYPNKELTNEDLSTLWEAEGKFASPEVLYMAADIIDAKVDLSASHQLAEERYQQGRRKLLEEKKLKNKKHASHELGAREFTLTYSPKWINDDEARCEMKKAIEKLLKYYQDDIVQLRAVGEVGSNGLSHVHCFYKLAGGLKITDKNFKRAWKYWDTKIKQGPSGHQGGHHATVRHESDFAGYIEKDVETAWLDVSYPAFLPPDSQTK